MALAQAVDDFFQVEQDSRRNRFDVLDNDPSAASSGFILTASAPSQGGQVTLSRNRRTIRYTPPGGFSGIETFTYTVLGGGFFTATVTVEVLGSNQAPNAANDRYTAEWNQTFNVNAAAGVLGNDNDPDNDTLSVTLTENVSSGALTLRSNGSFTYTPNNNFIGDDRFRYRVDDGFGGSDTATATISIVRIDLPPTIGDIPEQTGYVEAPFSFDIAPWVTDDDTAPAELNFQARGALPSGLALSPEGLLAGSPAPGTAGTHSVRFSVSDSANTVNGQFDLFIDAARQADLRVDLVAGPNPVPIGATATWSLAIVNDSTFPVDSVAVDARFSGSTTFNVDTSNLPGCTVIPDEFDIVIGCAISTIGAGETTSLDFLGSSPASGDVLGVFGAISEAQPEADPNDNGITTALSIAAAINRESAQIISGFSVTGLAAGDLDSDGFTDLVAATGAQDTLQILFNVVDPANDRKRRLSDPPVPLGEAVADGAVAVNDLDGDGDLDIVAAGVTTRVYLNDGSGLFTQLALFPIDWAITAVSVGDVDGDGFADLAIASDAGISLARGTGIPGDFSAPQQFGNSAAADAAVVDVFGDLRNEIVVANLNGDATILEWTGSALVAALTLETGPTTSITAQDFNGDGGLDLLFGREQGFGVGTLPANPLFLNVTASDPEFVLAGSLGAAPTVSVLSSDTDTDGFADAIVVNRTGAHQVFKNTGIGDGSFSLAPGQIATSNTGAAATGSFSVDTRGDLAVGGPEGIAIFLGDGVGNFGPGDTAAPMITLMGTAEVQIVVGDTYNDPGAVATDTLDGDVSTNLVISNNVDTSLIGDYSVNFEVSDSSGNVAIATRSVRVTPRDAVGGGGGGPIGLFMIPTLLGLGFARRISRNRLRSRRPAR